MERDQKVSKCDKFIIISTHTLTWSVTFQCSTVFHTFQHFNSHAHVERDWITAWARHELFNFNSHAHVERDGNVLHIFGKFSNFNSHAHVERDEIVQKSIHCLKNFNSHAHVERDHIVTPYHFLKTISTHTLTWSVTFMSFSVFADFSFQLTRSRGA